MFVFIPQEQLYFSLIRQTFRDSDTFRTHYRVLTVLLYIWVEFSQNFSTKTKIVSRNICLINSLSQKLIYKITAIIRNYQGPVIITYSKFMLKITKFFKSGYLYIFMLFETGDTITQVSVQPFLFKNCFTTTHLHKTFLLLLKTY